MNSRDRETGAGATIVRARRFVSAPVGRYPAPVRVGAASSAGVSSLVDAAEALRTQSDRAPVRDPIATAPGTPHFAAGAAPTTESPGDLDSVLRDAIGHGARRAPVVPPRHEDDASSRNASRPASSAPMASRDGSAEFVEEFSMKPVGSAAEDLAAAVEPDEALPRLSPIRRVAAILVGGIFGALVGVTAGLVLLALLDPPRWLERISNPEALWLETSDPLSRGSAIALVAGFTLVGALLPLRSRR